MTSAVRRGLLMKSREGRRFLLDTFLFELCRLQRFPTGLQRPITVLLPTVNIRRLSLTWAAGSFLYKFSGPWVNQSFTRSSLPT